MKPSGFALLADENIRPEVLAYLRERGMDAVGATEIGLAGAPDHAILQAALHARRVVVTHDRDFGALAVAAGRPMVGILYLRPGHIDPRFTILTLEAVFRSALDPEPPFILVAVRSRDTVRIRVRTVV